MAMRPLIAVIGNARIDPESDQAAMARTIGRVAVRRKCRIQTGGLSSLPRLVAEGARAEKAYREGDLVALAPGFDPAAGYGDIIIPTGMDVMRNTLVASGDVVVAVGGGAGTLSEIALAWQLNRTVLAWTGGGWSARLAGERLDDRREDRIIGFDDEASLDVALQAALADLRPRHLGIVE